MAVQPGKPDIALLDGIRLAACYADFVAGLLLVHAAEGKQAVTGGVGVSKRKRIIF